MSSCLPSIGSGNAGLAFGVVTAAGLSTALGAGLAFIMPHGKGGTNLFLAGSLGIAAGVMLFVSFVEIFADKAVTAFADCLPPGKKDKNFSWHNSFSYLYATLCFFGGVALTYIFELLLHYFEHWILSRKPPTDEQSLPELTNRQQTGHHNAQIPPLQAGTEEITIDDEIGHEGQMVAQVYKMNKDDARALTRMGVFAGIALAFHIAMHAFNGQNFPEGLATFVAVMDDPKVGVSVAVAIAIHNIPEGICVAIPIYYATGSRMKGFIWATLSGISELVGALLGFIVLRKFLTQTVYGILFGIVGGMMVYISLKQLLPTAHKYDPEDKVTTMSLIAGMTIMSLSLVLFKF